MSAKRSCKACGGPSDPLHTGQECSALQRLTDMDELDRYDLSVVSAVIARAGGSLAAAVELHRQGWLRGRPR